jgi:hypothetical protein
MNRHVSQGRKIRAHRVSPTRLVAPTRYDVRTVLAAPPNRARAEIDAIIRDATIDDLRSQMLGQVVQLVAAVLCGGGLAWLFFLSFDQMVTHPVFPSDTVAGFLGNTVTPALCLLGAMGAVIYAVLVAGDIADTVRALLRTRRDVPRSEA